MNGRLRRILPIPARSGGGRLTETTPAVQPGRRERFKVPHLRHSPTVARLSQVGGNPPLASTHRGGGGADSHMTASFESLVSITVPERPELLAPMDCVSERRGVRWSFVDPDVLHPPGAEDVVDAIVRPFT